MRRSVILFLGRETGGRSGSEQQGSQLREVKIYEMQNLGAEVHSEIKHFPTLVPAGDAVASSVKTAVRSEVALSRRRKHLEKKRSVGRAANLTAIPKNSGPFPSQAQLTSLRLRRNRRLQFHLGGQVLLPARLIWTAREEAACEGSARGGRTSSA